MSDLDDLGSLDDDLGSLDDLEDFGDLETPTLDEPVSAPAPAPSASAAPSGLGVVMQDLLARRNFQQVIQIAENQKEAVARDPQARALVEQAQAELERDAYIKSFLDGARKAVDAGERDRAKELFDKARSLQPDHPAVREFADEMRSRSAASAAAAPRPPEPATQPAPSPSPAETQPLRAQAPRPAAPQPAAPQPAAPQPPVAPQPAAPQPEEQAMLVFDDAEPLDFAPASDAMASLDQDLLDAGGDEVLDSEFDSEFDSGLASDLETDLDTDLDADLDLNTLDLESLGGDLDSAAAGGDLESLGVIDTEPEEQDDDQRAKIQELLAEGQRHFEADRLQDAIDVWSRVFLIDIDNGAASDRIEKARQRKAEKERQAEEAFQQAAQQIEGHDLDAAKDSLRQVLELQPNHPTAEDYLQQLEAGQVPSIKRQAEVDSAIDLLDDGGLGDLQQPEESERDMAAAVARDRIVVTRKADRKMVFLAGAVGATVLVLLVLVLTQWNSLFPSGDENRAVNDFSMLLERAKRMHESGKLENAILVLEGMPNEDVGYAEAQILLAQWRAEVAPPTAEVDTGPSVQELQRREAFLNAARQALDIGEGIRASVYLSQAQAIQELDTEEQLMARSIRQQLELIQPQIDEFKQGLYVEIIPQLWRLREEQPESPDIRRLLVDSYYNLALDDLQKGLPADAASKLRDVIDVEPDSNELRRLLDFAETYSERGEDLLFRIYVKYLPRRKYD